MLSFEVVRRGNHVSLSRLEADGSRTPLTRPQHRTVKGSTLRTARTQTGISHEEFLKAWERSQRQGYRDPHDFITGVWPTGVRVRFGRGQPGSDFDGQVLRFPEAGKGT